jgi:tRNA threonylcarbamoyladenosine biosynthesis protein TsaE
MDVGRTVGAQLAAGAMVHLNGDLGAGKTVFVRGLAEGIGIDQDDVSSPTFTLIQEYQGRDGRKLFHVDLYRLAGNEVGDLGLDALASEGIVAIEWANRLPDPDRRAVVVTIEEVEEETRRIQIDGLPGDS